MMIINTIPIFTGKELNYPLPVLIILCVLGGIMCLVGISAIGYIAFQWIIEPIVTSIQDRRNRREEKAGARSEIILMSEPNADGKKVYWKIDSDLYF